MFPAATLKHRPRLKFAQRMWCALRQHDLSHIRLMTEWVQHDPERSWIGEWRSVPLGYHCSRCECYVGLAPAVRPASRQLNL